MTFQESEKREIQRSVMKKCMPCGVAGKALIQSKSSTKFMLLSVTPVSEVAEGCVLVNLRNASFLMFWGLQMLEEPEQPISDAYYTG